MSSEEDDGLTIKKMDYLKGKYIFRYPYTFTSIKWGVTLGSFFGLHTYVRSRNVRQSFVSWIEKTVFLTFAIWGYFYTKYNFYQNSINEHELDEEERIRESMFLKKYLEFKLKVPENANLSQQELLNQYQKLAYNQMERSSQLDFLLNGITATTFDKGIFIK